MQHQAAIDGYKAAYMKQHGSILFVWLIAAAPEAQGKGLGELAVAHNARWQLPKGSFGVNCT